MIICPVQLDPSNFILELAATSYLGLVLFDLQTPVHL